MKKKSKYERYFKRIFDFIFSVVLLVSLSPIILAVSLLILILVGRPVIFKQNRPGKGNKIFTMYKFRTMKSTKDRNGYLLPDKDRMTKVGKFLRSTSIDELPELINVLVGDMSFVGPRPLLVKYLDYYTTDELARHSVRPGITGLSQVNGRNNLGWDERLNLDVKYVRKITLKEDTIILVKTIFKVIKKDNVIIDGNYKFLNLDDERKNNE